MASVVERGSDIFSLHTWLGHKFVFKHCEGAGLVVSIAVAASLVFLPCLGFSRNMYLYRILKKFGEHAGTYIFFNKLHTLPSISFFSSPFIYPLKICVIFLSGLSHVPS